MYLFDVKFVLRLSSRFIVQSNCKLHVIIHAFTHIHTLVAESTYIVLPAHWDQFGIQFYKSTSSVIFIAIRTHATQLSDDAVSSEESTHITHCQTDQISGWFTVTG